MSFLSKKAQKTMDPFWNLQREINSLFNQNYPFPDYFPNETYHPQIDVSETDKEFQLVAELPGIDKDDIEIEVKDNTIFISGEKNTSNEAGNNGVITKERFHGTIERTYTFSSEIDPEKISAKMKNGILEVNLSKTEQTSQKSRKIQIK